jgi:hypothetical protein
MRNDEMLTVRGRGDESAFLTSNAEKYQAWRSEKLARVPDSAEQLLITVAEPGRFSDIEVSLIQENLRATNMAIYDLNGDPGESKADLVNRNRQLGLAHLDGNLCSDEDNVTSLRVNQEGRHKLYIPYTNRRLVWHSDGYYNDQKHQIRGMALHCVQQAECGGESMLLDHELAYMHLRDQDPAFIDAFFALDALTIPPNIENGVEIRGARTGPVFSILENGALHMRYSARTRNIEWKADAVTEEAVACLSEFLENDNPYVFEYKLKPGQGLVCNNVLHARKSFEDADESNDARLLYRARYYDRVENT